jgi:hypothetical protein
VSEPLSSLRPPGPAGGGREVLVRQVAKDGRSVALLRAVDYGDSCVVETEVYPSRPGAVAVRPGPYTFASASEASAFVSDAVEALVYLGCDIQAQ